MVVIKEAGVGFGCGFVVGSDQGEFDLILGLDLVLGLCFIFYSAKEERERKVKPLPWKKMTTGREVVSMSVGTKRRN